MRLQTEASTYFNAAKAVSWFLYIISLEILLAGETVADSEGKTTTLNIIRSLGFIGELYTIESNGVPLSLYRIINPLADPKTLNKYPVLYGHGVLYDAMSMISRSEDARPRKPILGQASVNYGSLPDGSTDYSLPFMFSNNNFDVWMYDARGTNDNNRNATTNTDPALANKFWDFSLDDEGLIDLPRLIDFVLTKTASEKLVYVGYSESTFFLFALLSTAPEYADKVAAAILMAPVAYVSHLRGLTIPLLAPVAALVPDFVHYNFAPQPVIDTVDVTLRNVCQNRGLSNLICGPLIDGIGGKGVGQHRPGFFRDFFHSTSLKAIKQFLQLFIGKRFGMYDYGTIENMRRYGRPNPPAYNLARVRSDRLILARGGADFLSTPEDQERLIKELGRKPYLDLKIEPYNHFDFIDGKNLVRLVNGPAMLAVYELMYKDGPNILKSTNQLEASSTLSRQLNPKEFQPKIPTEPAGGGVTGLNVLLEEPGKLISGITGAANILNNLGAMGAR